MGRLLPAVEVIDLLDYGEDVEQVYFLIQLVEGRNAAVVPTCIGEARDALRGVLCGCGEDTSLIYTSHDVEDRSLYLGRCPGEEYT